MGTHGQSHANLTKDIFISSTSPFVGDLGKVVEKATSTSCNYKVLGDCFVLSGFSRPNPPKGRKWKMSRFMARAGPGAGRVVPLNPGTRTVGGHPVAGTPANR